jgi:hypothetical protein
VRPSLTDPGRLGFVNPAVDAGAQRAIQTSVAEFTLDGGDVVYLAGAFHERSV